MDDRDDVLEELECGICMELYSEPCSLPCIHTFCRICIARHIISKRQEHEKNRGFLCPLCRFYIRVPRPDKPMEQWASQMPKNTKIEQIIAAIKKGRLESVGLTKCSFHPEESVISFCKTCKCVACSTCLKERHPSCTGDAFYTIREFGAKRKFELANQTQELDVEVRRMTSNVDLVMGVMSGLKDAEKKILEDINHHADISIQTVTQEEAELLDKLDSAVEMQLKQLRLSKNPADEASDLLRNYKEEIESLMKSSTGLNYMDNVELAKERHRECLEMIQRLQSQCRPPTVTFIEREVVSDTSLGTLDSSLLRDPVNYEDGSASSTLGAAGQSGDNHTTYM